MKYSLSYGILIVENTVGNIARNPQELWSRFGDFVLNGGKPGVIRGRKADAPYNGEGRAAENIKEFNPSG